MTGPSRCHGWMSAGWASALETHQFGPGKVTSEATFVARHQSATEGDGWLLTYVYDGERGGSDLVILDAADLRSVPLTTVRLPGRVPVGFHGDRLPDH